VTCFAATCTPFTGSVNGSLKQGLATIRRERPSAVVTQADATLPEARSLYVRDECIKKATTYIEEHFRSKLTRSQMAATAHLSAFYFSRLFRRHVGFSPEAYVLNCRLRYAAKLRALRGPDCSLADVAADSAFADRVTSVGFFDAPSAKRPDIQPSAKAQIGQTITPTF
jgi:transcriptional regulator GlxA family with amidase domain